MIYNYKCPKCNKVTKIEKPMSESGKLEKCSVCNGVMNRVYDAPSISTGDGMKR